MGLVEFPRPLIKRNEVNADVLSIFYTNFTNKYYPILYTKGERLFYGTM